MENVNVTLEDLDKASEQIDKFISLCEPTTTIDNIVKLGIDEDVIKLIVQSERYLQSLSLSEGISTIALTFLLYGITASEIRDDRL